jgi:hypothetical protein
MHSDKKHAKLESNAKVKEQFYHVHKEADVKFNNCLLKTPEDDGLGRFALHHIEDGCKINY